MNIAICDDNEPDIKYIKKIIKNEFDSHNIKYELKLYDNAQSFQADSVREPQLQEQ